MTTTDYGKQVGCWCPVCRMDTTRTDVRSDCGRAHRWIPVYAVIPPGERPPADEPDEDTVCRVGGAPGAAVGRRWTGLATEPCAAWVCTRAAVPASVGHSLADAGLWVAEGSKR